MKINFLTKDSTVFPPRTVQLPAAKASRGPADSKIAVLDRDEYPAAKPDSHGDFLYKPGQPQFDACEPYGVLKLGMALYSRILGRNIPLAFKGKIKIFPHDDEGINAYYNRDDQAVHFLYFDQPPLKQPLEMAESLDVGAHEENGHLMLDGLRPQFLNMELESQAFHEAFGDISSMILSMQFDEVLDKMLAETKGDLRKSNVVSRLAAEAGKAIQQLSPHPKKNHDFLRDATYAMKYRWKYRNPEALASWTSKDDTKLGAEPHNFSRLFSGVWYEIFVSLYESERAKNANPKTAAAAARDTAASLILRGAADFAPDTTARYEEMARAMLKADRIDFGGRNADLLMKIFQERNILPADEKEPSPPKIRLGKPVLSRAAAAKFLSDNRKALGLDKNVLLEPAEDFPTGCRRFAYRNGNGETFLVYHATQDFSLHGSIFRDLEGAEYKITGSLQLGFDPQGNLMSVASDLITGEKRDRIERGIRRLMENRHIRTPMAAANSGYFFKTADDREVPYFASAAWKKGKMVLERVPIFAERG